MRRLIPWLLLGSLGTQVQADPGCPTRTAEVRIAPLAPAGQSQPTPRGLRNLMVTTTVNRRAVEAGLMTEGEADRRGGTSITGTKRILVVPMQWADTPSPPFAATSLETELFDGPWRNGTLNEYYDEVSGGLFTWEGDVQPWTPMNWPGAYYEGSGNGMNPTTDRTDEAIYETVSYWDATVDYGAYDNDGPDGIPNSGDDDGYVDVVVFVHPETDGSAGGNSNIWAHHWYLESWGGEYETMDPAAAPGVSHIRVDEYLILGGVRAAGAQVGIGTFCHELGHFLGIRDLYDTTPSGQADSWGIGSWGLMGVGNALGNGDWPAHMCAWSKHELGWLSYFNMSEDTDGFCLPPVETTPLAVRLWKDGDASSLEYFLVENRQQIGFDTMLPGNGLLIWHIDDFVYDAKDFSNEVNGDETWKAIDLECSDGAAGHGLNADQLDSRSNTGDGTDPWCPSTDGAFSPGSAPDSRAYSGATTDVQVLNISSCGPDTICADFRVGRALGHELCIQDCTSDGCAQVSPCDPWWNSPDLWIDNDNDGIEDSPSGGIENRYWFRVTNTGPAAVAGTEVQLYLANPTIGATWPSPVLFGSKTIPIIESGETIEDYVQESWPDLISGFPVDYALGAVIVSSLDPVSSDQSRFDNNIAEVSSIKLFERTDGPSPLAGTGHFQTTVPIDLYSGSSTTITAELVERANTLPSHWYWDLLPGFGVFEIGPGERVTAELIVGSDVAVDGDRGGFSLGLRNASTLETLGGFDIRFEIDDIVPRAPTGVVAQPLPPAGDDPGRRSIRVSWNRVALDVSSGPEVIDHYDVSRIVPGDGAVLVGRVAVSDGSTDRIELLDAFSLDCAAPPLYSVRAVDAAGNVGAGALSLPVSCGATGVSEVEAVPSLDLWVLPNPTGVNGADPMVRYRLAVAGPVQVTVFDAEGRRIEDLSSGWEEVGEHAVPWDRTLGAGVYFVRVESAESARSVKIVVMR